MLILRAAVLSLVVMLTGCVGYSYQPVGYAYPAYPAVYGGYSPGYVARLSSHLPMDIAPDPTIGRLLITGMPPLTDPIMVIVMGIEIDIAVNL